MDLSTRLGFMYLVSIVSLYFEVVGFNYTILNLKSRVIDAHGGIELEDLSRSFPGSLLTCCGNS